MDRICSNCGQIVLNEQRQDYVTFRRIHRSPNFFGWLSFSRPLSFCNDDCLSTWLQRKKENKT